jgi:hypothetical protein
MQTKGGQKAKFYSQILNLLLFVTLLCRFWLLQNPRNMKTHSIISLDFLRNKMWLCGTPKPGYDTAPDHGTLAYLFKYLQFQKETRLYLYRQADELLVHHLIVDFF